MKCITKTVRHYWKYQYDAWTQPIATGNTTAVEGGNMITTAGSNNSGYSQIYGALDGVKSGSNQQKTWMPTTSTTWWQVKFPYKIKITGLTHYNSRGDYSADRPVIGRYYTSSDLTTPIGDEISTPNTNWYATEITGIPQDGILTDTIYFNKTGGGTYAGIGELEITATKYNGVVAGTSSDYDFYTDDMTCYVPNYTKRHYWKYQYLQWTQPVLTQNGTIGGDSFAVDGPSTGTNYPVWAAFGNTTLFWAATDSTSVAVTLYLYNPNPLKVSSLYWKIKDNNRYPTTWEWYGSNDNQTWTLINNGTNNSGEFTLSFDDTNGYTYFKLYMPTNNRGVNAQTITLTAQERVVVAGTEQDYDFYTDDNTYFGINQ